MANKVPMQFMVRMDTYIKFNPCQGANGFLRAKSRRNGHFTVTMFVILFDLNHALISAQGKFEMGTPSSKKFAKNKQSGNQDKTDENQADSKYAIDS